MIDATTGNITINNTATAIGPTLTRDVFLASALGRNSQINVENEPHCSYDAKLPAGVLLQLPVHLTLYFYDQQLESVSIMASDDRFGTSWNDWSEKKNSTENCFTINGLRIRLGPQTRIIRGDNCHRNTMQSLALVLLVCDTLGKASHGNQDMRPDNNALHTEPRAARLLNG